MSDAQNQPLDLNQGSQPIPQGTIRMSDSDIRTGILLELEAARVQARLAAIQDSAVQLKSVLFAKYELSPDQYQLNDWLEGFVPIPAPQTDAPQA